jgi:hypothetical protein
MAIKMFGILLNLSLIFAILEGFEASVHGDGVRKAGTPDVNCKELAAKLGKSWQSFNCVFASSI